MRRLLIGIVLAAFAGWTVLQRNEPVALAPPPVAHFSRVGDQPHLLVLSPTTVAEGPVAARHALEQVAANRSWFLFITHDPSRLSRINLTQFDAVVLNHISITGLETARRQALQTYTHQGGRLIPINSLSAAQQIAL